MPLVELPTYTLFGIDAAERDPTTEDEGLSQTHIRPLDPAQQTVAPQRGSGVVLDPRR